MVGGSDNVELPGLVEDEFDSLATISNQQADHIWEII
jgi:hypothetical protein